MTTVEEAAPRPQALFNSFWRYAEGARHRWALACGLLVTAQALKLAVPWLGAQAINVLQRGGDGAASSAAWIIGGLIGLTCVSWLLHGPGRLLERSVALQVKRRFADDVYANLVSKPLQWHQQHHSAALHHRALKATNALYEFSQSQFIYLQTAVALFGPLIALIVLWPTAGVLASVGYAGILAVITLCDARLMGMLDKENSAERRYSASLVDYLGNIATVASLGRQVATRTVLGQRMDAMLVQARRSMVLNETKWCAVDLLSTTLCWSLVGLYAWTAWDPLTGLLLGNVFMLYQYSSQTGGVIGSIASNYQSFARMRVDFGSLQPQWLAADSAPVTVQPSALAQWRSIRIDELRFRYADHDGAERDDLDVQGLTLRRGERIAVVGPSGAGKSTLLRVLAGLYQAGNCRFEVDGILRSDLRSLAPIGLFIPQDIEVFEATLRENLTFGEALDEATIARICSVAGLASVIDQLPAGLDSTLPERGASLSGGQKQRLALARGLLAAADRSLIMLDEPTSNIDPITEALILRRLAVELPDACLLVVVHRLGLLAHFDRVLLIDAGKLIDSGSIYDLYQRQPLFRELLKAADVVPPAGVRAEAGTAIASLP